MKFSIMYLKLYKYCSCSQQICVSTKDQLVSVAPPVSCSIPQVLMDDVVHPPAGGLGLSLYIGSTNTIFLFVAVCVAYGMVSSVGQGGSTNSSTAVQHGEGSWQYRGYLKASLCASLCAI